MRLRELTVPVPGLPPALAGVRIAHLSDFHLGVPSRGVGAVQRAVAWAAERRPDLVCITGDLLTHPRGSDRLRRLLEQLPGSYVVLGNHDFGVARDPVARAGNVRDASPAILLGDETAEVELRGRRVQLVGVDPRTYMARRARPATHEDGTADLRILLCHFPRIVDHLPEGAFQLVLAGHLHDGQIALPYVLGKLRLAHLRHPYPQGLFRFPGTTLYVSPGLGTTFLPLRFAARPEATELVLQPA